MASIKICPAGGNEGDEVEYTADSISDFVIEIDGHKIRCKYRNGQLVIPGFEIGSLNVVQLPNSTYPAWAFNLV